MPPQQFQGLLDLLDGGFGFGAHRHSCTDRTCATFLAAHVRIGKGRRQSAGVSA